MFYFNSSIVFAEFDAKMRFHARAAKASPREGLKLLNQLDKHFSGKNIDKKE